MKKAPAGLVAVALWLAASLAGGPAAEPRITEYEWWNEGAPAGEQTVTVQTDGTIVSDMRIQWNNRDFTLRNEMMLDAGGYVVEQRLSGTSAFGAPIDEVFEIADGVARWRSASEQGSGPVVVPAFYVPARTGATESVAALIRAGMADPEGRVRLLPAGEARVTKLVTTSVSNGTANRDVTLYSITGLRFAPRYAWLDADMTLFGYGFWGLSMLPKGWGTEVDDHLKQIRSEHEQRHYEAIAARLAEPVEGMLAIENVAVVDVETGELLTDRHVLVEGGRITHISEAPVAAARRIDGAGKTLVPGLWDMHAHTDFFSHHGGILNIAGGVTSVRDMGSDHDALMAATRRYDAGSLVGPRIYHAGFIDKTSPFAASRAVGTLEEAKRQVAWYADNGYIQIKLYSSIAPDWVRPLADLAHARGLRVGGHIPAFMTAEQAILNGFDEIQHINMVFLNFLAGETEDTRTQLRFYLYGDKAGTLDLESAPVRDFLKLLAERGVVVDPTVAVFDSMIGHRAGQPNPLFTTVVDRFPIGEYRALQAPGFKITDENAAAWASSQRAALRMVRKLHDAGIQIVAGTDALPGFALHRELELYAEAGLSNAAILKIATIDAARVAGADDVGGSIAVGKRADLVLLDGNPLEDIGAVRRPVLVVKGDRLYRPDALLAAVGIAPAADSD